MVLLKWEKQQKKKVQKRDYEEKEMKGGGE